MIIDGKKLARDVLEQIRNDALDKNLTLAVVIIGNNPVSQKYIERKKEIGEQISVSVVVHEYPETVSTDTLLDAVRQISADPAVHGVIVQMPLPGHLDTDEILNCIPPEKDVDALGVHPLVFSPVVLAIQEIFNVHGVSMKDKKVVVLGKGKLVGKPVAVWAEKHGAQVTRIDRQTENQKTLFADADIIIAGAGVPRLIKKEDVKEGVVLIDAATSEMEGDLVGDIDPSAADRASVYTPVPGGVGPLTVVMLFANLLALARIQKET